MLERGGPDFPLRILTVKWPMSIDLEAKDTLFFANFLLASKRQFYAFHYLLGSPS